MPLGCAVVGHIFSSELLFPSGHRVELQLYIEIRAGKAVQSPVDARHYIEDDDGLGKAQRRVAVAGKVGPVLQNLAEDVQVGLHRALEHDQGGRDGGDSNQEGLPAHVPEELVQRPQGARSNCQRDRGARFAVLTRGLVVILGDSASSDRRRLGNEVRDLLDFRQPGSGEVLACLDEQPCWDINERRYQGPGDLAMNVRFIENQESFSVSVSTRAGFELATDVPGGEGAKVTVFFPSAGANGADWGLVVGEFLVDSRFGQGMPSEDWRRGGPKGTLLLMAS